MDALSGAQTFCSLTNPRLGDSPLSKINQQPVLLISLATISGVLLDSCCPLSHSQAGRTISGCGWCIAIFLCLALLIRAKASVRRTVAVLVFVALGGFLHNNQISLHHSCTLWKYLCVNEQPTVIRGIVDRPSTLRNRKSQYNTGRHHRSPWQTQLEVKLTELRVGQYFQACDGRVLIVIEGQCRDLLPGDVIEAYGNLCRFDAPSNPGQRDPVSYTHLTLPTIYSV